MSSLLNMVFKLPSLLLQDFGAAFLKSTKNVILQTNLMRRLSFGIQKTTLQALKKLYISNSLYVAKITSRLLPRLYYLKVNIT